MTRTSRAFQVADALSGDGAASAAVDAELARRAEAGGGARFVRADASRARRRLLRAILASAFLREHADAAAVIEWALEAYGELEAGEAAARPEPARATAAAAPAARATAPPALFVEDAAEIVRERAACAVTLEALEALSAATARAAADADAYFREPATACRRAYAARVYEAVAAAAATAS